MLPRDPLLTSAQIIHIRKAELVIGVVVPRQISQDGRSLEDGEIVAVVVDDGGNAAIGTDFGEPGLLLDVLHDVDALKGVLQPVGCLQLLEDDGGFVAVRGTKGEELDAGGACEARWAGRGRHGSYGCRWTWDDVFGGLVEAVERRVEHEGCEEEEKQTGERRINSSRRGYFLLWR